MTEISFYHLERHTLEQTLPKLLEKVLGTGGRAVVMLGSAERRDALNDVLWTFDDRGFLPHGTEADGHAEAQPVWLTVEDENPNGATFLVLADGASSDRVGNYERCLELFDGRDNTAVTTARARWQAYKDAGHAVRYFQQGERGWEEKG